MYNEYLEKGKQMYVAKVTGIDGSILSKFKTGKFDLYPHLFEKLEAYLLENQIKQPVNQADISQESNSENELYSENKK